jgi:hypothetical protein
MPHPRRYSGDTGDKTSEDAPTQQTRQGHEIPVPTRKQAFHAWRRSPSACDCQPPRSFWIRAKQYTPGPISCGVCGQDFQPQTPPATRQAALLEAPMHSQVA